MFSVKQVFVTHFVTVKNPFLISEARNLKLRIDVSFLVSNNSQQPFALRACFACEHGRSTKKSLIPGAKSEDGNLREVTSYKNKKMGQAIKIMKYDRAANLADAVSTQLTLNNAPLVFHRMDDGVMGGSSITNQAVMNTIDGILFSGEINTNGGGFTSIRSPLENSIPDDARGIKLKVSKRMFAYLCRYLCTDQVLVHY